MKFKVQKTSLIEGLQTVQNAVSSRQTVPILGNAMLIADANGLTMVATDLEITIRCTVEAEILEEGRTTIPIRRFSAIVKEIPDGTIEITVDENDFAHLGSGSSRFRLIGLPAEEFPVLPYPEGEECFHCDKSVFVDLLRKCHYAAGVNIESRPELNGVLVSFNDGKISCVGTDGKRLALVEREVEFPPENSKDAIFTNRSVAEIMRLVSGTGDMKIILQENQAIFEFDKTVFCCKLVNGPFPNFRQVILAQCDHRIGIPREELIAVLRRVSLFTSEKSNSIRLTFEDNLLTVVANSPDVGDAHETIAVKYGGPQVTSLYNPDFILEPLRALTSDEIYFEVNVGNSPALIKSDIPFLYMMMPMRIDG